MRESICCTPAEHVLNLFLVLENLGGMLVKNRVFLGVSLCLLAGGGAWGALISQTNDFSRTVPGVTNVTFNQFDGTLGTLQSVEFIISGYESATITGENNTFLSNVVLTATLSGNLFGTNSLPGLALLAAPVSFATNSPLLGATDNNGTNNGSGPDFYNFGTITSGTSADSGFVSNAFLSSYVGLGTYAFVVDVQGGWNLSGVSDATLNIIDFLGQGNVVVNYTYLIPEVSAGWMLLPLLGAVIWFRRRIRS